MADVSALGTAFGCDASDTNALKAAFDGHFTFDTTGWNDNGSLADADTLANILVALEDRIYALENPA